MFWSLYQIVNCWTNFDGFDCHTRCTNSCDEWCDRVYWDTIFYEFSCLTLM